MVSELEVSSLGNWTIRTASSYFLRIPRLVETYFRDPQVNIHDLHQLRTWVLHKLLTKEKVEHITYNLLALEGGWLPAGGLTLIWLHFGTMSTVGGLRYPPGHSNTTI